MSTSESVASPGLKMDRTEASWGALEFSYIWFGLDVPPLAELRRALVPVIEQTPLIGSRFDLVAGRYFPVAAGDLDARAAELITDGFADHWTPQNVLAEMERDLGQDPFHMYVGPHGLAVRWTHALGDGWSVLVFVKHLIEQARTTSRLPVPWDVLSERHRDLLAVRSVLQRPGTAVSALRHRHDLSGGTYERVGASVGRQEHAVAVACSDADFLPALLEERTRRGVRTTTASIVLTGFRRHLAHRLVEPLPGAEVIYDTRSMSPRSARAFGNWISGVYVRPEDDDDVESVSTAAKQVRERGYHLIAAAAARRRGPIEREDRMVLAPLGRPRLTLTYLNRGGPQNGFVWDPQQEHHLVTEAPPNGLETFMLTGRERDGRLDLSISYYASAWPTESVEQVVADFLADPWADAVRGAAR